ncbi:MAG: hypothetical protein RL757_2206 [Bacteroidota bacterium]|jgi:hypothetical protein
MKIRSLLFLATVFGVSFLTNSCKPITEPPYVEPEPIAKAKFFNFSDRPSKLQFKLDGVKMGADSIAYGGQTPFVDLNVNLSSDFSVQQNNMNVLTRTLGKSFGFYQDESYSIFVYYNGRDRLLQAPSGRNITTPSPDGKPLIRLVNINSAANDYHVEFVSPGSGATTNNNTFQNASGAAVTSYKTVNAATYDAKLKVVGGFSVPIVLYSQSGIILQANKIYTLVVTGSESPNTFRMTLIQEN